MDWIRASSFLVATLALQAPGEPLERHEYRGVAMGGEARVVLYAPGAEQAAEAGRAALARIEELEAVLSDWRDDSELARLSARAGEGPVEVSQDLFDLLALAHELSKRSEGSFDVTAGPLVRLWRKAFDDKALPAEEELAAARELVGHELLELDAEARTVSLLKPGMQLDVGAIGKGYACDRALALLRERGFPRALVELGGDLAAGDPPPGAEGWRVASGCGAETGQALQRTVANQGVATSGAGARFLELGGVRYAHLLDARTGRALRDAACITVVAPDAALADALATVAVVLGPRIAPNFVPYFGAELYVHDAEAVPLFDGETLEGWTTRGGPFDGDALWTVEDGAIVGREAPGGEGGLLYTEELYTSFALELDVRLDHPFDSGIFLRALPGLRALQVTLDDREGGEIGAVHSEGYLMHNRGGALQWRRDAWNHVALRCSGFDPRLEWSINGSFAAHFRMPPDREGFAPAGRIGLQVHGGGEAPGEQRARFRRIHLRRLDMFDAGLARVPGGRVQPLAPSWELLLGEGLEGCTIEPPGAAGIARDGVVSLVPATRVTSAADFADLHLRLDFQLPPGADEALLRLRVPREDGAAAVEVPLRPGGGPWTTLELLLRKARLAVAVDGALVPGDALPTPDANAPAGAIVLEAPAGLRVRDLYVERL